MLKYHSLFLNKCKFFNEQFESIKVLADDEPDDQSSCRRTLWALMTFSNPD
jgi:hypothetical protein